MTKQEAMAALAKIVHDGEPEEDEFTVMEFAKVLGQAESTTRLRLGELEEQGVVTKRYIKRGSTRTLYWKYIGDGPTPVNIEL